MAMSNDTEIEAGNAFRETLIARADAHQGGAPLWHGWAIMDAFRAGAAWANTTAQAGKAEPVDPKRKHGYTVNLTDQEMEALEALAVEHFLPAWRVLLQGLRLYQATAHPVDLGPMLDPSLAHQMPASAQEVTEGWQAMDSAPHTGEHIICWDGFTVFEGMWNGGWAQAQTLSGRPWTKMWRPMPVRPSESLEAALSSSESIRK
jgi:hypothetical protein